MNRALIEFEIMNSSGRRSYSLAIIEGATVHLRYGSLHKMTLVAHQIICRTIWNRWDSCTKGSTNIVLLVQISCRVAEVIIDIITGIVIVLIGASLLLLVIQLLASIVVCIRTTVIISTLISAVEIMNTITISICINLSTKSASSTVQIMLSWTVLFSCIIISSAVIISRPLVIIISRGRWAIVLLILVCTIVIFKLLLLLHEHSI